MVIEKKACEIQDVGAVASQALALVISDGCCHHQRDLGAFDVGFLGFVEAVWINCKGFGRNRDWNQTLLKTVQYRDSMVLDVNQNVQWRISQIVNWC